MGDKKPVDSERVESISGKAPFWVLFPPPAPHQHLLIVITIITIVIIIIIFIILRNVFQEKL